MCRSFFQRYIPAGSTVLDVGAGSCDFINQIRATRRIALDVNPEALRYAAAGIEVLCLPLERLAEVIPPESVDVAMASNVFEHLRSTEVLLEVLAALFEVLRPGGRLIILQPNVRVLGGRFWDFLDHTLPLTDRAMEEAVTLTGFEVLERRARFLPYTTKSRLPKADWLVRLYLAFPPAHLVLGKQMLVVARRPLRPGVDQHSREHDGSSPS
ncbi:MAG: class I SAM-dependent methyltransferase [Isosphaeraceae bacterium]|nr:class I SAM-dependent methyltransferase [Isosphaeraceae bacterium]